MKSLSISIENLKVPLFFLGKFEIVYQSKDLANGLNPEVKEKKKKNK